MSEVVIKIEDLKKQYRLGTIGGGTLTADLQSWWAKVRGKEDPNSKIGDNIYNKNLKCFNEKSYYIEKEMLSVKCDIKCFSKNKLGALINNKIVNF